MELQTTHMLSPTLALLPTSQLGGLINEKLCSPSPILLANGVRENTIRPTDMAPSCARLQEVYDVSLHLPKFITDCGRIFFVTEL